MFTCVSLLSSSPTNIYSLKLLISKYKLTRTKYFDNEIFSVVATCQC